MVVPATLAHHMLLPLSPNRRWVKKGLFAQPLFVEQLFGPIPQGPPQPVLDGHSKPHFGAVHEFPGHITVQNLPEQPFALSVMHLEFQRNAPGKLGIPFD